MYCKHCGRKIEETELRENIRFCAGCGAPLDIEAADANAAMNAMNDQSGGTYTPSAGQQDYYNDGYNQTPPAGYAPYPPYPPQPPLRNKQDTGKKTLIIVLSVIIAALLLVAVLLMLLVFNGKDTGGKTKETETEAAYDNISPVYEEEETEAPATQAAKYTPGSYKNMAQSTINLRAEPSKYSTRLLMVGWGAVVNVTEVYEDTSATDETVRWWGKTNVSGYDGWVALYYFSKVG